MRYTACGALALAFLAPPALADKKLDDAVAKAEDQVTKGKPEEAVKGLQKVVQGSPSAEGYLALARLQEKLGSLDDAMKSVVSAVGAGSGPAKADALAAQSSLDLLVGSSKDAVGHAQEAVAAQATPAALAALARAQVRAQDPAAGLQSADKAVQASATSALAQEAKGDALLATGRKEESIAAYQKALELDGKLSRARLSLATALTAAGKHADAVAEAKKVTTAEEKNAEAYATLGLALLAQNPANFGGAIAEAQQGAFLNPKSVRAQLAVAKIFEAAGNLDQANAAYARVKEIDPTAVPARFYLQDLRKSYPAKYFQALFEKAKTAPDWSLEKGRALLAADKGWQEYTHLRDRFPTDGEVQAEIVRLLFNLEDYRGAAAAAKAALKGASHSAELNVTAGRVFIQSGENELARDAYKHAVELEPGNLSYRTTYALALGLTGQYQEGIAELMKVTSSPGYKESAGFTNLGWLYRNTTPKKTQESVAAYKKGLELDPKNAQAALGMGWAYSYQQSYDDSIASFQKSVQMDPGLASEAYDGTAWCYFFKQDMAHATEFLDKAQAAGRNDPRLRQNIARLAELKEKQELYKKYLEEQEKLRNSGPDVGTLCRQASTGDAASKIRAIRALGDAGGEAITCLIRALDDVPDVRGAAAEELGGKGARAKQAIPYLMEVLKTECGKTIADSRKDLEEAVKCEDAKRKAREAVNKIGR